MDMFKKFSKKKKSADPPEALVERNYETVLQEVDYIDEEWHIFYPCPKWALKWKRMYLQLEWQLLHRLSGEVAMGVEDSRHHHRQRAYLDYQKLCGIPLAVEAGKKDTGRKKVEKGKVPIRGQKMDIPSQRPPRGGWACFRSACDHPEDALSNPRGGQGNSHWLTCMKCGQRWENLGATMSLDEAVDYMLHHGLPFLDQAALSHPKASMKNPPSPETPAPKVTKANRESGSCGASSSSPMQGVIKECAKPTQPLPADAAAKKERVKGTVDLTNHKIPVSFVARNYPEGWSAVEKASRARLACCIWSQANVEIKFSKAIDAHWVQMGLFSQNLAVAQPVWRRTRYPMNFTALEQMWDAVTCLMDVATTTEHAICIIFDKAESDQDRKYIRWFHAVLQMPEAQFYVQLKDFPALQADHQQFVNLFMVTRHGHLQDMQVFRVYLTLHKQNPTWTHMQIMMTMINRCVNSDEEIQMFQWHCRFMPNMWDCVIFGNGVDTGAIKEGPFLEYLDKIMQVYIKHTSCKWDMVLVFDQDRSVPVGYYEEMDSWTTVRQEYNPNLENQIEEMFFMTRYDTFLAASKIWDLVNHHEQTLEEAWKNLEAQEDEESFWTNQKLKKVQLLVKLYLEEL